MWVLRVTEWIRDLSDSVPFRDKIKKRKYPYQPGYPLQSQITRISSGLVYVHEVIFEEQSDG